MKRLIFCVCAGLFVATIATPSFATDLVRRPYYKAPVYVPPEFTWNGLYVGVNGGYGWASSNWSSAATNGDPSVNGWLLGGTVGYNMQTVDWVWGLEVDADFSTIKGSTGSGTGVCSGAGCETRNRWFGTGRARIGYAWDRLLPYITGGAAFGDIKMSPNTGAEETRTRFGWTVGGGVEYAFGGPWSAKVEYLYTDLGSATCSAASCGGTDTDVSFRANTVRAGVNYRF